MKGDVRTEGEEVRTMNGCMFAHYEHFILCIGNGDDFETKQMKYIV